MNIIPEPGLVVAQAVPFFVTLVALHHILFKPMLAYLEERDKAIEGVGAEARALQAKVAADAAEWEVKLASARSEMAAERGRQHQEAEAQRKVQVDKARAEAEVRVGQAIQEIRDALVESRATLAGSAELLAKGIAGRILEREA